MPYAVYRLRLFPSKISICDLRSPSPPASFRAAITLHFVDADHFANGANFFEGGKPKFDEAAQYTRARVTGAAGIPSGSSDVGAGLAPPSGDWPFLDKARWRGQRYSLK